MPDNTNGRELDEYAAELCREINGGDTNAQEKGNPNETLGAYLG